MAYFARRLTGDEIVIGRANQPLVRLMPVDQDVSPRIGGFWAGKIEMSDDWAEADREIEELFEASQIDPDAKL